MKTRMRWRQRRRRYHRVKLLVIPPLSELSLLHSSLRGERKERAYNIVAITQGSEGEGSACKVEMIYLAPETNEK